MSIDSVMRRAARPRLEDEAVPLRGDDAAPTRADSMRVASTLAEHIPAEALAVYTSALAFLVPDADSTEPQHYGSRWILAGAVTILVVLYAVGTYRNERRAYGLPLIWPWETTLTVVIAFAAWVCVVPGSPMNSFSWYTPSIGAVIGLLVSAFLGVVVLFRDGSDA